MKRREFIKAAGVIGGSVATIDTLGFQQEGFMSLADAPWYDKSMRWAQLAFVENDPGNFDPDFWLSYFKKIHADGALLSAGGVVAFYPTNVPLHHRSDYLGNSDPLGYLVTGCRKMAMSILLRTDPHAARQDVFNAQPDWIAVSVDGKPRRHWANPDLWVTCALGPFNFDFMTRVNAEIMDRFMPDGIFSNRWSGHGICYCKHCVDNFKSYSGGLDLPKSTHNALSTAMPAGDINDPAYVKYRAWRTERLKELWFLWDGEIRKKKSSARFIPNGFPDRLITGQRSDFFIADQQGRSGLIPPWANAKHAKELRATMGMKPQIGLFSVGVEEPYRWKDSVQSNAEISVWASEGVANGLRPAFVKFGAHIFDKRWMDTVAALYERYYRHEKYLRNTASMARVGLVYSEATDQNYGQKDWEKNHRDHAYGMYHALVEDRMPFEMVNDRMLDADHLQQYKLLILPNIAALSDTQCEQLREFVEQGGSVVATYETSLCTEDGKRRSNFGLSDLLGVSLNGNTQGPLQNSYLRIRADNAGNFHSITRGLEDAYRIINATYQVPVNPTMDFVSPVMIVPTYPDLPMEDVYPRTKDADNTARGIYLREIGKGRVVYFPGDIDRAFWQILSEDHGKLIRNAIRWALNEESPVQVTGKGLMDVTLWKQENSMTVHLVNLTNPMMMKGPFRELIPVAVDVRVKVPSSVKSARLLFQDKKVELKNESGWISLNGVNVVDHEILAIDV